MSSTFPNYANISIPFFSALITFPLKKGQCGGALRKIGDV